jgi:hypothetical protein
MWAIFSGQPKTTKTHIRKIQKEPEEEEGGKKKKHFKRGIDVMQTKSLIIFQLIV